MSFRMGTQQQTGMSTLYLRGTANPLCADNRQATKRFNEWTELRE